jgi:hypothetical protein
MTTKNLVIHASGTDTHYLRTTDCRPYRSQPSYVIRDGASVDGATRRTANDNQRTERQARILGR